MIFCCWKFGIEVRTVVTEFSETLRFLMPLDDLLVVSQLRLGSLTFGWFECSFVNYYFLFSMFSEWLWNWGGRSGQAAGVWIERGLGPSLSPRTSSSSHTELHQKVVQLNMFVGCLLFLLYIASDFRWVSVYLSLLCNHLISKATPSNE